MFTEQFNDCSRNYLRDLNMKMARLVTELGIRARGGGGGQAWDTGSGAGFVSKQIGTGCF